MEFTRHSDTTDNKANLDFTFNKNKKKTQKLTKKTKIDILFTFNKMLNVV